jgi:DNA-directed RNA polymerase specialized sigma24 family protein
MSPRSDPDARTLTPRAFALLLQRLGDDPERGGESYESLRRTLVRFFDWRGAHAPDVCADETLDRLARRLDEDASIEDVRGYAHGIARLVLLEQWRRPRELPAGEVEGRLTAAAPSAEEDPREACFERCLAELPPDGRALILEYYAAEGRQKIDGRKRQAAALGLSDTALRNRAQRLRDRLERCIRRRLEAGADTKP